MVYSHGAADAWCLLRLRAAVVRNWHHWGSDGTMGTGDAGEGEDGRCICGPALGIVAGTGKGTDVWRDRYALERGVLCWGLNQDTSLEGMSSMNLFRIWTTSLV